MIIAPNENPFLAGVVEARTPGGHGGEGGPGGAGGRGGAGGPVSAGACQAAGHAGAAGANGPRGAAGPDGRRGPEPQVITVPNADALGNNAPPEALRLLASAKP